MRVRCSATSKVAGRPAQVHVLELLDQQPGDRPVAVPLAIRRHDVPGCALVVAALERVAVGIEVVLPEAQVVEIAGVVLPVLGRVLEPRALAAAELVGRDVQEALHDARVARRRAVPRSG